jgi:small-conductance mechanosensitive channel
MLEEGDQLLPYLAAQVPRLRGVGGADECTHFDALGAGVGDLHAADLTVPLLGALHDAL